jgi:hypothetical protein
MKGKQPTHPCVPSKEGKTAGGWVKHTPQAQRPLSGGGMGVGAGADTKKHYTVN